MRVLGIDPGTAATGFGVIEVEGSRMRALDLGVITTAARSRSSSGWPRSSAAWPS